MYTFKSSQELPTVEQRPANRDLPLAPAPLRNPLPILEPRPGPEQVAPHSPRECGRCTVCCIVPQVDELRKPMRRACDFVTLQGCRIYDGRPDSCRQFECLWLRGGMGADPALRPDLLGVLFDQFTWRRSGEIQTLALEVWPDAFRQPIVQQWLDRLNEHHRLVLNNRAGEWSERPARIPGQSADQTGGTAPQSIEHDLNHQGMQSEMRT